ncbi:MAG: class I adenylate-forming enzyme family protein [Myxococcota bacterium]
MNLLMLLEMAASGFPDRVAIQFEEDRLSYAELRNAAGVAAREIRGTGCERVGLLDVTSLAVPIGLFAAAASGLPFVPLSYRLTRAEIERLVERIAPSYLIVGPERTAALTQLPKTHVVDREDFLGRARSSRAAAEAPGGGSGEPDAIAALLFTSGTTGAPKAAIIRHRHLVSYVLGSVEFGSAGEEEAVLVSVPPYHIAGVAAIVSAVYAGRRIVQLPQFSPESWLELARREAVTHAFVVPTMLARIVEKLGAARSAELPALRALSYGGGKMPQSVIEAAMRLFPETEFTNAYGLTETSSTIAVFGPQDHREAARSSDPARRRRLGSVGRPLPSVEVEIRDGSGRRLRAGERGEIYVRGAQVSGEYLDGGSRLDADGWFSTRDGGWRDEEGYLFVEGRADDVIVRGGENMSPGEIEAALLDHAAVRDAAVVGVPDEQWGEAVAAVIVTRPGARVSEEELREWVRQRLRSSRTPARIEFRDELPYNETGKLLRRKLRAELAGDEP